MKKVASSNVRTRCHSSELVSILLPQGSVRARAVAAIVLTLALGASDHATSWIGRTRHG